MTHFRNFIFSLCRWGCWKSFSMWKSENLNSIHWYCKWAILCFI